MSATPTPPVPTACAAGPTASPRCWPVATDDFGYANLAIRGRKLHPILDEQLEPALALAPDLVSIHAGANDVLRPRVDLDDLASAYDAAIGRIVDSGAHVVMFTIFDPGSRGIYAAMRGRMAIFNEFAREISERHDATLVDMWRMRDRPIAEVMDTDRMHLNASRPPAHRLRRARRPRRHPRRGAAPPHHAAGAEPLASDCARTPPGRATSSARGCTAA